MSMKLVVLLLSLSGLISCQTQDVEVFLVDQSTRCNNSSEQIFIASSQGEIDGLLSKGLFLDSKATAAQYDFDENVYVFVGAGQKPAAGYHLEMMGKTISIKNNKVVLPMKLIEPKPGNAHAQMITSPCAVLSAKRSDVEAYLNNDIQFVLQGELKE